MAGSEGTLKTQPHELTPRDDVKKTVSEVLKRVDNFIHKGDLEQAELYVAQARELDPRNIYAYAFQERIAILKDQAHQNSLAAAACKTAEEAKRKEVASVQSNALPSLKEHPRPQQNVQAKPQSVPQGMASKQPVTAVRNVVPSNEVEKTIVQKEKNPPPLKERIAIREVPMEDPQVTNQPQDDAQRKSGEDRDLKIQRMIKTAFESARKEVELKQMEIRAKEREEFARREQARIEEAAETARKAEEQRQNELRKKSEEQLQQKIREALQRKPVGHASEAASLTMRAEIPAVNPGSENQPSGVTPADAPVSSERLETLERYKLVLSSVWADGAVSEEEAATLKQLRQALSISAEEHVRLEKGIQRDTYIEAFKKAWNSGTITPENASVLAELRQRFKISNEEHLSIETRILWELQPVKDRPTLLVIDDDERLLNLVSKTLNEAGFITTPVTTSDEAYAYLMESSPDLILCDVNLETSTMGGFAFYEKVREFERLRETPFIFLSGLSDEALVRTGKELGADDYLSKPISEETLVATIRGKLRRYHDIKKRLN